MAGHQTSSMRSSKCLALGCWYSMEKIKYTKKMNSLRAFAGRGVGRNRSVLVQPPPCSRKSSWIVGCRGGTKQWRRRAYCAFHEPHRTVRGLRRMQMGLHNLGVVLHSSDGSHGVQSLEAYCHWALTLLPLNTGYMCHLV